MKEYIVKYLDRKQQSKEIKVLARDVNEAVRTANVMAMSGYNFKIKLEKK